jgi:hypothetical protein
MLASAAHPLQSKPDALEIATNQAIAACDGDVRATVRTLIIAVALLESELTDICASTRRASRPEPHRTSP